MSRPIRLVTLLLALSFFAGCSSDDASDNEPAHSDRIEELIEGYLASYEANDEQALRALVTDDYIDNNYFYRLDGTLLGAINVDADSADSEDFPLDMQNELVGEAIWEGDWPWIAAYREHWEREGFQYDGIATYVVIVDDDATLKIANRHWAGTISFED